MDFDAIAVMNGQLNLNVVALLRIIGADLMNPAEDTNVIAQSAFGGRSIDVRKFQDLPDHKRGRLG
jgi:hypothetical protein